MEMKDIKNYEGIYAITKEGQIWSYRLKRFLTNKKQSHGYTIEFRAKHQSKSFLVAKLVYATWNDLDYSDLSNGKFQYKDNNKFNINLENLTFLKNTNEEEIKQIPYASNYGITKNGEVWSYLTNKFLSHGIEKNTEEHSVTLMINKKSKKFLVHRLVLSTWSPVLNWENLQVNHKDENRNNNSLDNLEWCTPKYNSNYGTRNERSGEHRKQKVRCVETGQIFNSQQDVQKFLNQKSPANISSCLAGRQKTCGGFHWERVQEEEEEKND